MLLGCLTEFSIHFTEFTYIRERVASYQKKKINSSAHVTVTYVFMLYQFNVDFHIEPSRHVPLHCYIFSIKPIISLIIIHIHTLMLLIEDKGSLSSIHIPYLSII